MMQGALKALAQRAAGPLAVTLLRTVARLPLPVAGLLGGVLLPFYRPFRRATCARLARLGISPRAYYRTRLRLALLSLRHLLGRPDGLKVRIEGAELYEAALATGRPVALLGWHQGPVELLHRIPSQGTTRPFFLMTAGAFSPLLAKLMVEGRRSHAAGVKTVIRPDSLSGLRAWERDRGVLAVMVDQVRGKPEEWLSLKVGGATVHVPWPKRLMEWLVERRPELLAVQVRLEGRTIHFRYKALDVERVKAEITGMMERAMKTAPHQYNWSYPKIRCV